MTRLISSDFEEIAAAVSTILSDFARDSRAETGRRGRKTFYIFVVTFISVVIQTSELLCICSFRIADRKSTAASSIPFSIALCFSSPEFR